MIAAGQLARLLDRNALGQRVAADRAMAALDDILHRRIKLGLDPDHLDPRLQRLGRRRHAGNQPAAADRNDQRVEIRRILEHFQRDRPRAGHHRDIVERVDEDDSRRSASSSRAWA